MKIEINIDENLEQESVEFNLREMNPKIAALIESLKSSDKIVCFKDGKTYLIDIMKIQIIRTEGRDIVIYDNDGKRVFIKKNLYELEEILPIDFIRISKSAIINIKAIDYLEEFWNMSVNVIMKNSIKEKITRSYFSDFRKRIGV